MTTTVAAVKATVDVTAAVTTTVDETITVTATVDITVNNCRVNHKRKMLT